MIKAKNKEIIVNRTYTHKTDTIFLHRKLEKKMGNGCSGCNCNKNEKQDEIQADV